MAIKVDKYQLAVLKKLYLLGIWGKKHTDITNLAKGFPKDERGNIKKATKKLIQKGLLVSKITYYGKHVSLNVKMKREIEKLIGIE
jgi:hypothetical protein